MTTKVFVLFALAAVVLCVRAAETELPKNEQLRETPPLSNVQPPVQSETPDAKQIENLKPKGQDSKVYGSYSGSDSSIKMVDGKVVSQKAASRQIDNDNGHVVEKSIST